MADETLCMVGAPGSPYSRKLRAILRYRRIAYTWVTRGTPEAKALPKPKVQLLPQLILPGPDGAPEARTDTTPLIRELEKMYSGRSVVPSDPVIAFLDALVEDYGDEWLTKCMFHYRWAYAADIDKAARILPRWFASEMPEETAVAMGQQFAERQIERLWVVGSNETTGPVIEASYHRLLGCLDARLTGSRFVMGARPGSADFALYGQLTQLATFDPTPAAVALAEAPRVAAWVDLVEELSGLEPEDGHWLARSDARECLGGLLEEIGRVYVPFLLANADALASGADQVDCTIDGKAWVQRPFPYQGKCLGWLREGRAALSAADRSDLDAALAGTGCEALFG
ncbi:MAG: glutathione S-transferase [Deltaproteobacteria bacterium]|nr:glutathione S-transferase [Deltaproteobacteria bacterium]MBW2448346.1 glutathione S-transferase [Deltaproteobacteria bacterium]